MSEQNHPWCRDTARDEAVRAAEDAAAVPAIQHRDLPEQVALLRASVADILGRVVRIEGEIDGFKAEAEEAAPAVFYPASPADGFRTERVTLEIRHDIHSRPVELATWVRSIVVGKIGPLESVRVVEQTETMRCMTKLRRERDAARAERDAARAECERLRAAVSEACRNRTFWHQHAARRETELTAAKDRVAELEAANAGGEAKQEPVAWGVLSAGEIVQVSLLQWRDSSVLWSQRSGGTVVPLYAAPPEPRGWLTAEEREEARGVRIVYDAAAVKKAIRAAGGEVEGG